MQARTYRLRAQSVDALLAAPPGRHRTAAVQWGRGDAVEDDLLHSTSISWAITFGPGVGELVCANVHIVSVGENCMW
jgi:hypothetical protein